MSGSSAASLHGGGATSSFKPLVTVVDFHHARGPEVESWFGAEDGVDPAVVNEWPLLPFMALSDGAHASKEDFSYFTLRYSATDSRPATSLFGISCTRQMDASLLLSRPPDVTRSTVQKAVVVIADSPQYFGMLRERLSMVTNAWFAQRDFTDMEIISKFQESLAEEKEKELELERRGEGVQDKDQYLGMSLRELVKEFKWQTLVLFKCCLLQPKMLFFGSRCERLCMMQFSLISLIPGLIRNLQDCADPDFQNYEKNLVKPTSLKTSDRRSLLAFMGLPLQIFGKGSLFGPYTPLQQLDILADFGTKSYIVGSTNSLLLQQKDRYSDILINLDEMTINITSTSLRSALTLSSADRRWIDFITQSVNDTWDESNPGRPKTMGYVGSEEFIRLQFEEYLLSLLSAVKCHEYLALHGKTPLPHIEGDPSSDFGSEWIEAWSHSDNYRIFQSITDSHLFDIVEPRHPCAGGLTIDDVQRRLAQQVQELHLDERFAVGKEVIGRNFEAGKQKASTVFNKLYADMEALREAQRRKHEEHKLATEKNGTPESGTLSKAGAYFGSWATWAGEKRKSRWGGSSKSKAEEKENFHIRDLDKDPRASTPPVGYERPKTQESYRESIFEADHHEYDGIAKTDEDDDEESDVEEKNRLKEEARLHEAQMNKLKTEGAGDGFSDVDLNSPKKFNNNGEDVEKAEVTETSNPAAEAETGSDAVSSSDGHSTPDGKAAESPVPEESMDRSGGQSDSTPEEKASEKDSETPEDAINHSGEHAISDAKALESPGDVKESVISPTPVHIHDVEDDKNPWKENVHVKGAVEEG